MDEPVFTADIQNKIHEVGLLRPGEQIALSTGSCVLLEYYTEKTYSYRMVELTDLKAKYLFTRQKPLNESDYPKTLDRIFLQSVPSQENSFLSDTHTRARCLLRHIFQDILPKHGMQYRENQAVLAMEMLEALQENKLALCEAEVGTGKTHAYILAVTVYNLFIEYRLPTIISTSTIALQKALTEEYIPQISDILMEHRIIDKPLSFVVRKGKSHYACDSRVKNYRSSLLHNNRIEDSNLLRTLNGIFTGACPIDLDGLLLTDYVKSRICVERCQMNCDLFSVCRYRNFIHKALTQSYDFQIANHNLVLADILSRKSERKPLLPQSGIIVFDEAHKLLDAARQMYGMTMENMELERLAVSIYHALGGNHPDKAEIIKLCKEMLLQNSLFFEALKRSSGASYDKHCYSVQIDLNCILALKALMAVLRRLSVLFFTVSREKKERYGRLVSRMEKQQSKLSILFRHTQSILWLETSGAEACRVCALPKQLDYLLFDDIWSKDISYILTSGTLSMGGDFSHSSEVMVLIWQKPSAFLKPAKPPPLIIKKTPCSIFRRIYPFRTPRISAIFRP